MEATVKKYLTLKQKDRIFDNITDIKIITPSSLNYKHEPFKASKNILFKITIRYADNQNLNTILKRMQLLK